MIAKAEWFSRRKYMGWGLSIRTWQGWLYIFFIIVPFAVLQALPFWSTQIRIYLTAGWLIFVFIDVNHAMFNLKKDERETKIEALGDRNAAWFMVFTIVSGILYQLFYSALQKNIIVDWFLIGALFGGAIVKTISNLYLERTELR
jgi:hypothetical protein